LSCQTSFLDLEFVWHDSTSLEEQLLPGMTDYWESKFRAEIDGASGILPALNHCRPDFCAIPHLTVRIRNNKEMHLVPSSPYFMLCSPSCGESDS
jgi:hypothetical protein